VCVSVSLTVSESETEHESVVQLAAYSFECNFTRRTSRRVHFAMEIMREIKCKQKSKSAKSGELRLPLRKMSDTPWHGSYFGA